MSKARSPLFRLILEITSLFAALILVGCGNLVLPTGSGCSNRNGVGGFTVHVSDINANGVVVGDDPSASAYGNWASNLANTPLQGCIADFGSSSDFLSLPYTLQYGEAPALWSGAYKASCIQPPLTDAGWSTSLYVGDPINPNGGGPLNMLGSCSQAAAASFFELSGSTPTTITVPGTGLSTTYGPPRLELNSIKANGLVSATQAISVAGNGTSATFYFPVNSQARS